MTKYHISSKGEPAVCRARIQCRLKNDDGSPAAHFESKEDAQKASENILAKKHGLISTQKKNGENNKTPIERLASIREKALSIGSTVNADRSKISEAYAEVYNNNLDKAKEAIKNTALYKAGFKTNSINKADSIEKMKKLVNNYDSMNEYNGQIAETLVRDSENSVDNDDYNSIRAERLSEELTVLKKNISPKASSRRSSANNSSSSAREERVELDRAELKAQMKEVITEKSAGYKSSAGVNAFEHKKVSHLGKEYNLRFKESSTGEKVLEREHILHEIKASYPGESISMKAQDEAASKVFEEGDKKIIESTYDKDDRRTITFKTWRDESNYDIASKYFESK